MKRTNKPEIRLGIDVGGTNTDAVLMTGNKVIAAVKHATSPDVGGGVVGAVSKLLMDSGVDAAEITHVMVGTTQFINAFLQRKHLSQVGVIRVSLPKADGVPPRVGWPEDLAANIGSHIYMVQGGAYHTGKEYAPLDEEGLCAVAEELSHKGVTSIAVSSNFAPLRPDIEERSADIIRQTIPEAHITLSSQVGGIGLIDRENAAIINAALVRFAHEVVDSMAQAFASLQIRAPLLISQNDGTLITSEYAKRFPILTCSAGPTNSIRGAAFLTGLAQGVVVDVGGTTTDIGFLSQGFPRETTTANYIGGVRTNFRMPDVISVALGGGTVVHKGDSGISIGPDSVGYQLLEKGIVFGGDTLTATDIVVRAGDADLGDPLRVSHICEEYAGQVVDLMHRRVEEAVDQMRTSGEPLPVILVGGGSILLSRPLQGASDIHRPEYSGVANAVGAAIAQVSGRVDKLYDVDMLGREAALEQAKGDAVSAAVQAGADPDSVEIIDITELPMTHMKTGSTQIIVRAVGDLLST